MNVIKGERVRLIMILAFTSILILSTVTIIPSGKCQVTKVYESTDVPKHIDDLQSIESFINIQDRGTIEDINVKLTIYHIYDADLNVYLTSPSGTEITLFNDVGGNSNNFINTILDDEASTSITAGSAPFTSSYRPEESLSKLNGEEMQGIWILRVYDDTISNEGNLVAWSIEITYSSPSPPIWFQWWFWLIILGIIVIIGIAGILVLRRKLSPSIIPTPPPPL
jgi:subtilisin-like proprotein convertase family protein